MRVATRDVNQPGCRPTVSVVGGVRPAHDIRGFREPAVPDERQRDMKPTDLKRGLALSVLVLWSVFATACGSAGLSEAGQLPAADGEWVLDALVLEGDMAIPLPDHSLDLRIDGTQLGGNAGCNSMGGSATFAGDGSVDIDDLFSTAMACESTSVMAFEQQYLNALIAVTEWTVDGDRLTLQGPGVEAAYVRRVTPPDLPIVGTAWTLDTFFDGDVSMNAAGMDEVRVTFSDASVRVSGRCWTISGFATIEPGGQGNLSTDFASADPGFTCDDRSFFGEMVERLSEVNEYRIDENRLTLGASGIDLLGLRG